MQLRTLGLTALSSAALSISTAAHAATSYTVTNLGVLGTGNSSTAYAVNNSGMAAGQSNIMPSPILDTHGFISTPGSTTLTDIPTFQVDGGGSSIAYGINANGVAVGTASTDLSGNGLSNRQDAFIYSNGTLSNIGNLGGYQTTAYAINSASTVVGTGGLAGSGQHGFRYTTANGLVDLGSADSSNGSSSARAINASGLIAGGAVYTGSPQTIASTYNNGTWTRIGTTPGGIASQSYGINASGEVVGSSFASTNHAFAYTTATGIVDLGNLGGSGFNNIAYGVNDAGSIVGVSSFNNAGSNVDHAFITTLGGTMMDLNSLIPAGSGWVLRTAYAISNTGYITGVGTFNGVTRAFELTAVPEPVSLSVLSFGALLLTRRRRGLNNLA